MFAIYILYSHKDHELYLGCTNDLEHRVKIHNAGGVDATKNRRPLELMHSEYFEQAVDAYKREKFLKSLWAGRFKKKLKAKFESRLT